MSRILGLGAILLVLASTAPASAQTLAGRADSAEGEDTQNMVTQKWRIGLAVEATGAPVTGVVGTVTVPTDWPEQQVRLVSENVTRGARVKYQNVAGAAQQMVMTVPGIRAGSEAEAVMTYEIRIGWPPPGDTTKYKVPELKRLDRELRQYLSPSPLIESDDPQIRAIAERVGKDAEDAWSQVEAVYDWGREKVRYDKGSPLKGALAALRDGNGDCDELSALFIAVCRAQGVPARSVRVPGHVYAEFYLVDKEGKGRWFPCENAGARSFGTLRAPKPILQKGDAIRARNPQTRRMQVYRFLPENLVVRSFQPGSEPKLKLICEPVTE